MTASSKTASSKPTRYVVSATLVTCSPLAIHSGLGSEDLVALGLTQKPFRTSSPWNFEELESCDQLIVRDWENLPYIPGSSLKGVIRNYLRRFKAAGEPAIVKWMLGSDKRRQADDVDPGKKQELDFGRVTFEDGFLQNTCFYSDVRAVKDSYSKWLNGICSDGESSGAVRSMVKNAIPAGKAFATASWRASHERLELLTSTKHLPYFSPRSLSYVEHRNGIDRRTGAVGDGRLFSVEAVPAGVPFQVQFVVDHGVQSEKAVELLLRALAGFNLDPLHQPIQLGADSNLGWGRMACIPSSIRIRQWTPEETKEADAKLFPIEQTFQSALQNPPATEAVRVQVDLELSFTGTFLVDDPSSVCAIEAVDREVVYVHSDKKDERKPLDFVPRVAACRIDRPTGSSPQLIVRALLPASGFRGAFRSQLERTLRTINSNLAVGPWGEPLTVKQQSPTFVKHLLGFHEAQSHLWCSEFVASSESEISQNVQEMVAIDRFTGGAADGAKYNVLFLYRPSLRGAVVVDLPDIEADAKSVIGIMALALRDLIEGDIAFGMGDTKGFGHCLARVSAVTLSTQPAWLQSPADINAAVSSYLTAPDADALKLDLDEVLDGSLAVLRTVSQIASSTQEKEE